MKFLDATQREIMPDYPIWSDDDDRIDYGYSVASVVAFGDSREWAPRATYADFRAATPDAVDVRGPMGMGFEGLYILLAKHPELRETAAKLTVDAAIRYLKNPKSVR